MYLSKRKTNTLIMLLWRTRVLFFYFTVFLLSLICCPILVVFHWCKVSYDYKYSLAKLYSEIFVWCGETICGLKYKIIGLDKLPKSQAVFMSNHQSFWENVFMQLIVPKHSWVIKKELFNIPLFGLGLKMMEPIAIDRKDLYSLNKILKEGQKKISQGLSLVIFPESTRILPHQNKKFKPSAIKLAMNAKVPVVLIAHNAGMYWPKNFWIRKPGTIIVEIVSVIAPETLANADAREVTLEIEQVINTSKNLLAKANASGTSKVA